MHTRKNQQKMARWNSNRSSLRPSRIRFRSVLKQVTTERGLFATLFTQSVHWWSGTNDGTMEQKEKYGIFSVQWAIKAIIWQPLFGGSAPPRYGGERPGDTERQHQFNENQKYGAINTGESICPHLSSSIVTLRKIPRNLDSV